MHELVFSEKPRDHCKNELLAECCQVVEVNSASGPARNGPGVEPVDTSTGLAGYTSAGGQGWHVAM